MGLRKYTKEWIEELCKDSSSYSEVLRKAGRVQAGGSQALLKKKQLNGKLMFLILKNEDGQEQLIFRKNILQKHCLYMVKKFQISLYEIIF